MVVLSSDERARDVDKMSEDVVKSEALLPRLALLIYRYDGTPQTPVDTPYTLCP